MKASGLGLLLQALTHTSYAHEDGRQGVDNERLEFMGDAVVQMVITEHLYELFPESPEGDLARMRAAVVKAESLAQAARRMDLGAHLLLGRGEGRSGGRDRTSLLSDAFEAITAAVYLDSGWEAARSFVLKALEVELSSLNQPRKTIDPKSALQERLQATSKQTPHYQLVSESGPDHEKRFVSEVLHEGKVLGRGVGQSKKASEQAAAAEALKRLERSKRRAPAESAPRRSLLRSLLRPSADQMNDDALGRHLAGADAKELPRIAGMDQEQLCGVRIKATQGVGLTWQVDYHQIPVDRDGGRVDVQLVSRTNPRFISPRCHREYVRSVRRRSFAHSLRSPAPLTGGIVDSSNLTSLPKHLSFEALKSLVPRFSQPVVDGSLLGESKLSGELADGNGRLRPDQ